jgi:hypothetical protein
LARSNHVGYCFAMVNWKEIKVRDSKSRPRVDHKRLAWQNSVVSYVKQNGLVKSELTSSGHRSVQMKHWAKDIKGVSRTMIMTVLQSRPALGSAPRYLAHLADPNRRRVTFNVSSLHVLAT